MKMNPCSQLVAIVVCLLSIAILFGQVSNAQSITDPNAPATPNQGAQIRSMALQDSSGDVKKTTAAPMKQKAARNRAKLLASNNLAWQNLLNNNTDCTASPKTQACADAAIVLAMSACSTSAILLQRDTKAWQITDFAFIVASAAFTGVGASATLSQAKIFSTLGGTTGLGAVTATINANVTGDQGGITSINSYEDDIKTFILSPTAGSDGKSLPTPEQIFQRANIDASKCIGTAAASSGTPTSTPVTVTATSGSSQKPAS